MTRRERVLMLVNWLTDDDLLELVAKIDRAWAEPEDIRLFKVRQALREFVVKWEEPE